MSEYANKSKEELQKTVTDNSAKLQAFRFAMAGSKTKNVKEGRNLRKEIARLLTELRKRNTESRSSNIEKRQSSVVPAKAGIQSSNSGSPFPRG